MVDEHPKRDEGHVEPVQEVLDRDVHVGLHVLLVVEVEDTLGLCGNNAFLEKNKKEGEAIEFNFNLESLSQ